MNHDDLAVADINPVMLRVARQSRGLSLTALARAIPGIGYRRLKRQETWNPRDYPPRGITKGELRKIAEVLRYPEDFFTDWLTIYIHPPLSVHPGRHEMIDETERRLLDDISGHPVEPSRFVINTMTGKTREAEAIGRARGLWKPFRPGRKGGRCHD